MSRATVFTSVGGKKELLKKAYDVALVGDDEPIPFPLRPASLAVRAEPDPRRFLVGYTGLVVDINARLAPIYEAVRGAASADPEVRDVFEAIGRGTPDRRRQGRPRSRRQGRPAPRRASTSEHAADILWVLIDAGLFHLLVHRRGWSIGALPGVAGRDDRSASCWLEPMTTPPTIEQVIAAIPDWAGGAVTAERIPAGLTNTNCRVEVDGTPFFVRIPGAATDLLAVDRGNELFNTRAAAEAGVAPRVVDDDPGVERLRRSSGSMRGRCRTRRLPQPGCPSGSRASLRTLHAGPRFQRRLRHVPRVGALPGARRRARHRDPGRLSRAPWPAAADRSGAGRPSAADRPVPQRPARRELPRRRRRACGWSTGSTAATTTPPFELGNTAQELGYDDAQVEELCAAYFGEASPALLARMRLQMIMSDVGWTLWAAIQARISTIDYDFTGWAEERWARAAAALDGPDFEAWLQDV